MTEDEKSKISIEIKLPESLIVEMAAEGYTPSTLISELVLDGWNALKEGRSSIGKHTSDEPKPWDEESFFEMMDKLLIEGEDYKVEEGYSHGFEETADSISLLLAYWKLGSRPTSGQLMKCLRFTPGEEWHTFLRVAKLRLTVRARKMGRTPLFEQPSGLGPERIHPLNPEIHRWLEKWVASKATETGEYEKNAETERFPARLKIFEYPPPRPGAFPTLI